MYSACLYHVWILLFLSFDKRKNSVGSIANSCSNSRSLKQQLKNEAAAARILFVYFYFLYFYFLLFLFCCFPLRFAASSLSWSARYHVCLRQGQLNLLAFIIIMRVCLLDCMILVVNRFHCPNTTIINYSEKRQVPITIANNTIAPA